MGFMTAMARGGPFRGESLQRSDATDDESAWSSFGMSTTSLAGVAINQQTALCVTAVMACVTMLAEDLAKLTPRLFRLRDDGGRTKVVDHPIARLLRRPNDWQSGFEFREMMQVSLVLRGNAYALIIRNRRGDPIRLVPINADRCCLWEAPTGEIFYRVTPMGLHELAMLEGQPFLIPASDMLHIRGFSMNGLVGSSRIALASDAIGLAMGYEQQAARWMGNGSRPSGILTTDAKLTEPAAKRISDDWKKLHGGLMNAGKIAVLEQGLKFQQISLSASDLEFISSRQFQVQEIARIFRVPLHMIGDLAKSTNNNIAQQSQEYANYTLSGFTARWTSKFDVTFDLEEEGLVMDWDYAALTRADLASRYNAYRTGIMSMFLTPDEARIDDGLMPMGGDAAKLQKPTNMGAGGSQSTGTKADGGGRPDGATADGLGNV
ncbi:phage portal protein [Rhodoblastus sp. 17X3]|uniref:phage portal protein n=1 Tax=Rhodoblastus sp. 17X3 TaxID=3047026 RepID=UPI0024B84239|nr:phage portal protein [Rhodoblastus sp. 17X3]MDI9847361.1 phage portal protein [Rhodoblastus sp. 17X3]